MSHFQINSLDKVSLEGSLSIPPSKSQTLRALVFALMAEGSSTIINPLESPDTYAMIEAISKLGAKVTKTGNSITVNGVSGTLKPADDVIDCKNSGQVLRFIGALAGLIPCYTILTGDHSIRARRPVKPLLDGLQMLGAFATSSRQNDYAPIIIKGPIQNGAAFIDGKDSQPVSGLLIAGAFAKGKTTLNVENPGETPWIDLTLSWFDRLGIPYSNINYAQYEMYGNVKYKAFNYHVPGDLSSLAFPLCAALVTKSTLRIENVDLTEMQGDKKIIPILQKMGAKIDIHEKDMAIKVHGSSELHGIEIDMNECIDALPILAVMGCFAKGTTHLVNAHIAREKESDRINSICKELKKMGANIEEREDGLIASHSSLIGHNLKSYDDHRIIMSLSIAAHFAKGLTTIENCLMVEKTYPSFVKDLQKVGSPIKELL